MKKVNVFLGGTFNNSIWRNELIPLLENYNITYFNPVVDNWTEDCQIKENWHKKNDDYNLFVITKEMKGVFSIAEVVDLSNKRPINTILCVLYDGFDKEQIKSLKATIELVKNNGAIIAETLKDIAEILNNKINKKNDINLYKFKNVFEIKPDSENQNTPEEYKNKTSIFLAGTIDMGNSIDWQNYIGKFLDKNNKKCIIYNPRRESWPDGKSNEFEYQVNWELNHLESCTFIIMHILGTSKSPITLMELGLFARTKKLIVICEESFYRYGNVKITCERYNVPLYNNLDQYLKDNILKLLN